MTEFMDLYRSIITDAKLVGDRRYGTCAELEFYDATMVVEVWHHEGAFYRIEYIYFEPRKSAMIIYKDGEAIAVNNRKPKGGLDAAD